MPLSKSLAKDNGFKKHNAESLKDLITVKVYLPIGHLHPNNNNLNSELGSGLHEQEEHLAKVFGTLPPHVKPSGYI
jgi:hypothetical protein